MIQKLGAFITYYQKSLEKSGLSKKKNSQSKHAGVLFQDACTLILLSLSGGPNSDYLFVNLDFNGTICR